MGNGWLRSRLTPNHFHIADKQSNQQSGWGRGSDKVCVVTYVDNYIQRPTLHYKEDLNALDASASHASDHLDKLGGQLAR